MPHVLKVDISSDFPPALARPDHQRMLLCTRQRATAAMVHPILVFEPLRRSRIDKREGDQVAMLLTKLLERSVRYKGVAHLQFARGNERLDLANGNSQQLGTAVPRAGIELLECRRYLLERRVLQGQPVVLAQGEY